MSNIKPYYAANILIIFKYMHKFLYFNYLSVIPPSLKASIVKKYSCSAFKL